MTQQRALEEAAPECLGHAVDPRAPVTPEAALIDLVAAERTAADLLVASVNRSSPAA